MGPIEFIRVIERHQDWNPHVHLLFHFNAAIRVDNEKYFDRKFFDLLQREWIYGFSKPEVLKYGGLPGFAFGYVLKYFLKQVRPKQPDGDTTDADSDVLREATSEPKIWPLKGKRVTYFGQVIRLLAWSRGMQYLYQESQRKVLVGKGYNLSLPDRLVFRENRKRNCELFQGSGKLPE